jgi:hypothetical protein
MNRRILLFPPTSLLGLVSATYAEGLAIYLDTLVGSEEFFLVYAGKC